VTPSRHQQAELLRAAREGDRRARERIVAEDLQMIRAVARRYCDLGLAFDDLVQEGSLGLLDAIESFDPDRSADFEAYARFRARRAIRNALTEKSRLIRLPKQIVEQRRAIAAAERELIAASGRAPACEEIAAATGLSCTAIDDARRAATTVPVSLNQPTLDGEGLEAFLADSTARDPAAELLDREQEELLEDAVAQLPKRQRQVVEHHFGLGCEPEEMAEVADELHLSRQRTRTIERQALDRLRDQLEHSLALRGERGGGRDARNAYFSASVMRPRPDDDHDGVGRSLPHKQIRSLNTIDRP
jgi:RNA polymerase sigma factor (sigma-70 family)